MRRPANVTEFHLSEMNIRSRGFSARATVMGGRARESRRAELGRKFEHARQRGLLAGDWRQLPLPELERLVLGLSSAR